ncbi:MAG: hypothetical protein SW833_12255 [Cyanobacteriota bacterium]|nr:hypothetical protein [Cyanobacteriota bacterium]
MRNWRSWIPSLNAWINAIALVVLLSGLLWGYQYLARLLEYFFRISPKLGIFAIFTTYLSPILIIAIAHHILHQVLDRYSPQTRSPELAEVRGWFPTLMSWWEGLFGWSAIILSTFVSNILWFIIFVPSTAAFNALDLHNYSSNPLGMPLFMRLVWLVTSAYLYQLESLVRQHLMQVGATMATNNSE